MTRIDATPDIVALVAPILAALKVDYQILGQGWNSPAIAMDRTQVESIGDVLNHVLRNALPGYYMTVGMQIDSGDLFVNLLDIFKRA